MSKNSSEKSCISDKAMSALNYNSRNDSVLLPFTTVWWIKWELQRPEFAFAKQAECMQTFSQNVVTIPLAPSVEERLQTQHFCFSALSLFI